MAPWGVAACVATLTLAVSTASALTVTPSKTPRRVPRVSSDRGRWESKAPMPTARTDTFIAAAGGRIYVFGGFLQMADPNVRSAVGEMYDPVTDSWQARAPMLRPRAGGVAVTVGDSIYAFGGGVDDFTAGPTVEVYDVSTDTWSERATRTDVPNAILDAVLLGDRIYVFARNLETFGQVLPYAYDPERDTWTELAPLTLPPFYLTAEVVDGALLLFAGAQARVYRYDPERGDLTTRGEIPYLRGNSFFEPVSAARRVYGFVRDRDGTVLEYDPTRDSWRGPLEDVPQGLGFASDYVAVTAQDETKIYALGAYDGAFNFAYALPGGLSVPTPTPTATPPQTSRAADNGGVATVSPPSHPPVATLLLGAGVIALLAGSLRKRLRHTSAV